MRRVAVLVVLFSCSEHLPEELSPPSPAEALDAGTNAPALDADATDATDATTCTVPDALAPKPKIGFATLAYPALKSPVELVRNGPKLYALEQAGIAKVLHEDGTTVTTFADLTSRVGATGAGES